MTFFDWLDRHWFVGGWCAIVFVAGIAAVLHGIGRRIGTPTKKEGGPKLSG